MCHISTESLFVICHISAESLFVFIICLQNPYSYLSCIYRIPVKFISYSIHLIFLLFRYLNLTISLWRYPVLLFLWQLPEVEHQCFFGIAAVFGEFYLRNGKYDVTSVGQDGYVVCIHFHCFHIQKRKTANIQI